MEIGAPTTAPALVIDQSTSLQIEVFPPDVAEQCSNISRPTIRYVIFYKRTGCLSSSEQCQQLEVSSSTTAVRNISRFVTQSAKSSFFFFFFHRVSEKSNNKTRNDKERFRARFSLATVDRLHFIFILYVCMYQLMCTRYSIYSIT